MTDPRKERHCTPAQIRQYISRISGPLLDRIDIRAEVPAVAYRDLRSTTDMPHIADVFSKQDTSTEAPRLSDCMAQSGKQWKRPLMAIGTG